MSTNKRAKTATGPTNKMATRSMDYSERMTLLNLPKEILLEIIKSIGVEDISEDLKAVTRFAMTSKQSLIIAEVAVGSLKELRSLESRFGKPYFEVSSARYVISEKDGFKAMFPNISPQSPAPDLAYLNLNGSLSWLPPLGSDSDTDDEEENHFQEPNFNAKALEKLIAQAEHLYLKFPPSFLTLMRSEDLQRRIPFFDEKHFNLGSLIRCSPGTDRNAGGYVLRFLSGYHESWTANLYLDTMGQHCVLHSCEDICAEKSDEADDGQEWTGDAITLQALDFEEYMYHTWMNELGWTPLPKGKEISEAHRAYLERMQRI